MHQAQSQHAFDKMADIFHGTFALSSDADVARVAESFHTTWLRPESRRRNFFAGAAPGFPINQCAVENKHKEFKEGLSQNSSMNVLMNHIFAFMEKESRLRDPEHVDFEKFGNFSKEPDISADSWLKGFSIFSENKRLYHGQSRQGDEWVITANKLEMNALAAAENWEHFDISKVDNTWTFVVFQMSNLSNGNALGNLNWQGYNDIAKDIILKYKNFDFNDVSGSYDAHNKILVIQRPPNPASVSDEVFQPAFPGGLWYPCDVCTREFTCEHVVAARLFFGEVNLPAKYAQFKKAKKRQRGRPKNATGRGRRFDKDISSSDDNQDMN